MIGVLAARVAKLGELETTCGGSLVLGGGIVPVFADRALQSDDLAHGVLLKFGQPLRLASSVAETQKSSLDTPRRRVVYPADGFPRLWTGLGARVFGCVLFYYPRKGSAGKVRIVMFRPFR